MADTPRLNGVIAALEQNKPAFVSFCAAEIGVAPHRQVFEPHLAISS